MAERANMVAILRDVAAPTLGMAFFWPLLRHPSYLLSLFPLSLEIPLFGASVRAHDAFLALLALICVAALVLREPLSRLVFDASPSKRVIVAACGALGAAAAGIMWLASAQGMLGSWLVWVAVLFAAISYLALVLVWASHYAPRFDAAHLAMLGVALFLSFWAIRWIPSLTLNRSWLRAISCPLASSALWLACTPTPNPAEGEAPVRATLLNPIALLMAAFLVVGSSVRGVVDLQGLSSGRTDLAIALSGAIAVAAVLYYVYTRRAADPKGSTALFALLSWVALSLVFLSCLFVCLTSGEYGGAGGAVVVSRSCMEFAFWALLCHRISQHRVPTVPVFLVLFLGTEILSWLLSYVVVPLAFDLPATARTASPNAIVLAVMLGLAALALVTCSIYLTISGKGAILIDRLTPTTPSGDVEGAAEPGTDPLQAQARLFEEHGLTAREASVAALYAHGHSLAKVAEELGITRSTAQSHIKSVYRKLDVHSRDELIELVD